MKQKKRPGHIWKGKTTNIQGTLSEKIMSCKFCDAEQDSGNCTYVRVGRANVLVSGCDEHLKEMFEQLRKGSEK